MRNQLPPRIISKISYRILLLFACACTLDAFAQNSKSPVDQILSNPEYQVEWKIINAARANGLDDKAILKVLDSFEARMLANGNPAPVPHGPAGKPPVTHAVCSGLGVEGGWGAWVAATGSYAGGNLNWSATNLAPASPRFNLTSGSGLDACTPGSNPGDPSIPVVCPGFGNASIQLGQLQTNGIQGGCGGSGGGGNTCCDSNNLATGVPFLPCVAYPNCNGGGGTTGNAGCAERLTYPLTVTAADTDFIYSYAVVFEDPGHTAADQPFVSFAIYDSTGNPIPCAYQKYVAGGGQTGFYQASCHVNSVTYYKPWTLVGVNLSKYLGQTLTVEIINADCGKGGHYAQSYWDFSCGTLSGAMAAYCSGQPAHICAAVDPLINYTYQWYKNGAPYTGSPSGTSQCIDPVVTPGDTFSVQVMQPSNCNFRMVFIPTPITMKAYIQDSITCSTVYFRDSSQFTGGGQAGSWSWSFPGGNPSSSTQQNPIVTYPTGTYTVTCVVASLGGCKDSVTKVITLNQASPPVSAGNNITTCNGGNSVTLCASGANSYSWSTGSTATCIVVQPTDYTTYSVTGTAANGCTKTASVSINGGSPPSVTTNNPAPICFSTSVKLTASTTDSTATYLWSTGQTTTSINVTPANTGITVYTVTVTSESGCTNSKTVSVTVNSNPTVTASGGSTCSGSNITLSANPAGGGGTYTYSWSPSGGLTGSTTSNPVAHPSSATTYTVVVTDANGCTGTATALVTISPGFTLTTQGDTVCAGSSVTLAVGINQGQSPFSYLWSPPGTLDNSTAPNPVATPSSTTTYSVNVTDGKGCSKNSSVTVNVKPRPYATIGFGQPALTCDGYVIPLTFSGSSDVNSWYWDFGDGTQDTTHNPVHTYSYNATYTVTIHVANPYCTGSADTTLALSDMSAFAKMSTANVFTPNGNGKNDCFHPVFVAQGGVTKNPDSLATVLSQCVKLEIYDRWGIKMFETTATKKCWDGKTMGGSDAKEGTYYYIAKFGDVTLKGYVELLR